MLLSHLIRALFIFDYLNFGSIVYEIEAYFIKVCINKIKIPIFVTFKRVHKIRFERILSIDKVYIILVDSS